MPVLAGARFEPLDSPLYLLSCRRPHLQAIGVGRRRNWGVAISRLLFPVMKATFHPRISADQMMFFRIRGSQCARDGLLVAEEPPANCTKPVHKFGTIQTLVTFYI